MGGKRHGTGAKRHGHRRPSANRRGNRADKCQQWRSTPCRHLSCTLRLYVRGSLSTCSSTPYPATSHSQTSQQCGRHPRPFANPLTPSAPTPTPFPTTPSPIPVPQVDPLFAALAAVPWMPVDEDGGERRQYVQTRVLDELEAMGEPFLSVCVCVW